MKEINKIATDVVEVEKNVIDQHSERKGNPFKLIMPNGSKYIIETKTKITHVNNIETKVRLYKTDYSATELVLDLNTCNGIKSLNDYVYYNGLKLRFKTLCEIIISTENDLEVSLTGNSLIKKEDVFLKQNDLDYKINSDILDFAIDNLSNVIDNYYGQNGYLKNVKFSLPIIGKRIDFKDQKNDITEDQISLSISGKEIDVLSKQVPHLFGLNKKEIKDVLNQSIKDINSKSTNNYNYFTNLFNHIKSNNNKQINKYTIEIKKCETANEEINDAINSYNKVYTEYRTLLNKYESELEKSKKELLKNKLSELKEKVNIQKTNLNNKQIYYNNITKKFINSNIKDIEEFGKMYYNAPNEYERISDEIKKNGIKIEFLQDFLANFKKNKTEELTNFNNDLVNLNNSFSNSVNPIDSISKLAIFFKKYKNKIIEFENNRTNTQTTFNWLKISSKVFSNSFLKEFFDKNEIYQHHLLYGVNNNNQEIISLVKFVSSIEDIISSNNESLSSRYLRMDFIKEQGIDDTIEYCEPNKDKIDIYNISNRKTNILKENIYYIIRNQKGNISNNRYYVTIALNDGSYIRGYVNQDDIKITNTTIKVAQGYFVPQSIRFIKIKEFEIDNKSTFFDDIPDLIKEIDPNDPNTLNKLINEIIDECEISSMNNGRYFGSYSFEVKTNQPNNISPNKIM